MLSNERFKTTDAGFYSGFEDYIKSELPNFTNKKAAEVQSHWERFKVDEMPDEARNFYQPMRVIKPQIKMVRPF